MHIYVEAKDRENHDDVHIPHLNCLQETIFPLPSDSSDDSVDSIVVCK